MNRRLQTSLVTVSLLSAAAQGQIKPISGNPNLTPDLGKLQTTVNSYNVWAAGNARTSKITNRLSQSFIAKSPTLSEISVNVANAHALKVSILRENGTQLATTLMTAAGETAIATFNPALTLTPGDIYTVEFQNTGNATFYLSENEEAYVFSNAIASGNLGLDVNMKVTGQRPIAAAQAAPTKRALVILLENGGVKLSGVKELKDACPKITYWTCGSCKFEGKKGENFGEFMARVAQSLGNCMECVDPKKWHDETVNLDSWFKEFSDFALEEVAKGITLATTGTSKCKYDKVIKCEDGDFNAASVLSTIDQLAPNYIIDIHVLSHGGPNTIVGYNNQTLTPANFFTKIEQRRARGEGINIRAVYQMNCFSGSLAAEWLAVGADVVNGTKPDKLNMMPPQYFGFLKHWMNGEQFDSSVQKGYDECKWFFDALYANKPSNVTDSKMFIHGNDNLRFK